MLILTALLGTATAQDCDARALAKDLTAAAPAGKAAAFNALAECDRATAAKMAPKVVPEFLGDKDSRKAAVYAIEVGAGDEVRTWIKGLQSDEKARTISNIGDACQGSEKVQTFFVEAHTALGEDFWTDRWYRGLETCRVPAVQQLLTKEFEKGVGNDRSRFTGILETYSRNLAAGALDHLVSLGQEIDDPELLSYIVVAFSDAAQVGAKQGMDPKTAEKAAAHLSELAADWPQKAVEQTRNTLRALGDEQGADALAAIRYKDAAQPDGSILWGTVVVENATCKRGKTQQAIHTAMVSDPGQTWADQVKDKVKVSVNHTWDLDLAERCKGEGTVDIVVPAEPFASEEAYESWVSEKIEDLEESEVDRRNKFDHEPVKL